MDLTPETPNPPDTARPLAITAEMLAPVDQRVDFERGMSYVPPLSIVLIAMCVGAYILELLFGATTSKDAMIRAGALWSDAVMQGQIWRLVSAMFLHASPDHLIGNCLVLYALGMATEHAFGIARALAIYLISGICGSLLSLALTIGPSVGASGAIFGLSGALIVFLYRYHTLFFIRDKRVGIVLLVWAIYTVIVGFATPQVDNFAHIGGFIGGAIVGAILPARIREDMADGIAMRPPRAVQR